jgi:uncharacterized protein (UPF0297 family)
MEALSNNFPENLRKGIEIAEHIVPNKDDTQRIGRNALNDAPLQFSIKEEPEDEMRQILRLVHQALDEKGYNPISQMVGYILSEDPTYITTHNNARSLVRRIDRDELLQELVREYLAKTESGENKKDEA